MSTRHDHVRSWRRHPVLTTAALVALAPMMPAAVGGGDLGAPEGGDDAAGDDAVEMLHDDAGGDAESGTTESGTTEAGTTEVEADEGDPGDPGAADVEPDADDPHDEPVPLSEVDEQQAGETMGEGHDGDCPSDDSGTGAAGTTAETEGCETTDGSDEPGDVVEASPDDTPADEPGEPVTDEPVADEPVADEPVAGEPEPVAAEPIDPVADEPVADEPEPVADDLVEPEPADDPGGATVPADATTAADRLRPSAPAAGPADGSVDDDGDEGDDDEDAPDFGDAGLRAEVYDGVYAQGVPIWVAMAATRQLESGGNYRAEARGSTASGAYQVIDSTWNGYGGYRRAVDAPPAVQDQFAYESMTAILKRHGNEVASIPLAWYYPAALRNPSLMDVVPVPEAGNVLTPRQYQGRWMAAFHRNLEAGSPVFLPSDTDALIPAIAFPVLGPTWFYDDWHADRDGGQRRHEGLDFLGENGQPVRAAFDGVVTRIRPTNVGRPGVGITITRADGIRANYFHLDSELRWHPDLDIGDTVKAGQIIAYMGSTGNAGIPHLHFEIRTEDGEPIAPYPAVLEAIQREQCSVGIGPWSTEFSSPATIAQQLAERIAAQAAEAVSGEPAAPEPDPVVHEVQGPDGARWTIVDGRAVTAAGVGALIAPDQGKCTNVPVGEFGTGAGGLAIDLLPEDWWGEDVEPEELADMLAAVAAERSHEFDRAIVDTDDAFVRMMIAGGGTLSASILQTKHDLVTVRADTETADTVGHLALDAF